MFALFPTWNLQELSVEKSWIFCATKLRKSSKRSLWQVWTAQHTYCLDDVYLNIQILFVVSVIVSVETFTELHILFVEFRNSWTHSTHSPQILFNIEYGAIARLINHFGSSYLAVHFTEFPEMLEDKTGRSYKTISFLTSSEMQIQDNIF